MPDLGALLDSGEYSDFTLMCENQEFPVHKGIVCSQSPVIAAAMRGDFQVYTYPFMNTFLNHANKNLTEETR